MSWQEAGKWRRSCGIEEKKFAPAKGTARNIGILGYRYLECQGYGYGTARQGSVSRSPAFSWTGLLIHIGIGIGIVLPLRILWSKFVLMMVILLSNPSDAIIQFTNQRYEAVSSFTQVASGPNSVNIHFGSTPRVLKDGDVIVFDLGAWYRKNTSDISRTIPVSGKFTPEQAEIYSLVLSAQKEAIRLMMPGTIAIKPQEAAENVLLQGLQKLGLVTNPSSPWQRRFYIQHGFGHGIGLDVHDVWSWWSPRMRSETLKPGMVLTMEPGLYFPRGRLEQVPVMYRAQASEEELKAFVAKVGPVYAKYAGMGCRIEDDVLITETGNRVLSSAAPKEIADFEKMMKLPSPFNQIIK
jgi:methionine aminopeptidase